jgi:hypothetical protein
MSHRKAYGPHGYRTPERKAYDIALSILRHKAEGRTKTLADYGVTDPVHAQRIQQAIAAQLLTLTVA